MWGHLVITNIGTIGLEAGFAPIPCPIGPMITICSGKIQKAPVVVDDQIVIRPMMKVVYTVDHRFGDAALGIKLLRIIQDYCEDPEAFNIEKYPENIPYSEMKKKAQ